MASDQAVVLNSDGASSPVCSNCEYPLVGLSDYRCPECGTQFDPIEVESTHRIHLLPWERLELGGTIRRCLQTLFLASLSPKRFFASVAHRKSHRLRRPGGLILALLGTSVLWHLLALAIEQLSFLVLFWLNGAGAGQAASTMLRALSMTWSTSLVLSLMQILTTFITVLVISALFRGLFRKNIGSLQFADMVGLYSPTVSFGAAIYAFTNSVSALTRHEPSIMFLNALALPVVILLPIWFSCRRLFRLSRWKATKMLVIGCAALYGSGLVVSFVLFRVLLPFLE